jgi:hypothetical protein
LFWTAGFCRHVVGEAPLAGGDNSRVIEVRVEPATGFPLKLYPDHLRWKMAKEVFVYGSLKRDPALPTSEILVADDSGRVIPEAFVVMTKLSETIAAGVLASLADLPHHRRRGAALHKPRVMQHQFAKKLREVPRARWRRSRPARGRARRGDVYRGLYATLRDGRHRLVSLG